MMNFADFDALSSTDSVSKPYDSSTETGEITFRPVYRDHVDDAEDLARLGYKQSFHRGLSLFGVFSVSFSVLGLLPSVAATLNFSMLAGTPGMLWGWLIALVFVLCVAASMAELCSSMPTSGGLYYSAKVLAPKGWGPLAAWITGWSNYIAQLTFFASCVYSLSSLLIYAADQFDGKDFVIKHYHIYFLCLAFIVVLAIMASLPTRIMGKINSVFTFLNILSLLAAIIIILVSASMRQGFNNSYKVWNHFQNETQWPQGFAMFMSFCGVIWSMVGLDTSYHLVEECASASVNAPNGIMLTALVGGFSGWIIHVVIAYTVVDYSRVVKAHNLWVEYLTQVLSHDGAKAVIALTVFSNFLMAQGVLITSSRIAYSYARDGVLPFSKWIAQINKRTTTPVNAVIVNSSIALVILLFLFVGQCAIDAIFAVSGIAAFVAFIIPIGLRSFVVKDSKFCRGAWNLGRYSRFIGGAGTIFVLIMIPILCFPTVVHPSAYDMNWTSLGYSVPMAVVVLWFALEAKDWFKGPKTDMPGLDLPRMSSFKGNTLHPQFSGQSLGKD
ncbi:amino acid permease [Schizosaccharomyces japonicus yFS275]|uniref:Amino acid permease n=1 Tax=Schizosaccharomyces japonicus (strain yFS275 / FY16936) TaxID=402676 RepID=B6K1K3_SCHJY|nr:amino acid permease [Schizosaccharomyces japonicus yFS275]EEB07034.2 amino acid permease [Schizosaccharomyces japonicus yFS275]